MSLVATFKKLKKTYRVTELFKLSEKDLEILEIFKLLR